MIRHYNIPVFIPERACPFQCIYCNQQKITGQDIALNFDEIRNTIEKHLESIPPKNAFIQIAFFGGTFTAMPMDEQELFLKISYEYILDGKIQGVRLSTRPDYIDQEILDLLKKYGVTNIELGAQSLDNEVLKKIHRGHSFEDVKVASKLILDNGFTLGLQMMVGLPGDNSEKAIQTAQKIVELGATETRIYPTLIIKDTTLHKLYTVGKYTPINTEDAISQSAAIFNIFEKNHVKVLRVGLYPDENLMLNEVVAGPSMYNFKEKVITEIWWEYLKTLINSESENKNIRISVAPKQLNSAIGYQAVNRKGLFEKFNRVKFTSNPSLKSFEYNVDYY